MRAVAAVLLLVVARAASALDAGPSAAPVASEPLDAGPGVGLAEAAPPAGVGRQSAREQARDRAFEQTEDLMMPLSPAQLQMLIQSLEITESLSSAHAPPETVMGVEPLRLDATRPPMVRLAQGYGTSIVFTDRTGRLWPITAYQGFNEGLFAVSASTTTGNQEDLPGVLVVQPVASAGAGNLVVTLKDLETPIVLTLTLGQTVVDARKEYKLPLAGPNAGPEYHALSPRGLETALLDVLNGLPPVASAIRVDVVGVEPDALAWRVDGELYLRTVAELYSPEYSERASQPSGLHAYKLRHAPVLLVSYDGQMTEVLVQE